MSGNSNIPDSGKLAEDKCDLYDSTVDSGFLSGQISDILSSADIKEEQEDDGQRDDSEMLKEDNLRLDSGVCLSESFSSLSLKNPDLNNLSCANIKQQILPIVEISKSEIWRKYYEQDNDGDTHLHVTIVCGRVELVEALIRIAPHHRLLDTPNDDAQTPLHLAVETNQHRIARMLLAAGAKNSPRDVRGDSPLHIACRNGDVMSVRSLIDPIQKIERDRLNLSYQPPPIDNNANLDQWNYVGQTCVHVAASNGHVDVLRHLYWKGANINAREGCMGYTALHFAVERRDEEMVKFLLTECPKLDVSTATYGGRSALQLTPIIPDPMLRLLLIKGVSPYNSESEYDSDESTDSDDDMLYDPPIYAPKLVGASA